MANRNRSTRRKTEESDTWSPWLTIGAVATAALASAATVFALSRRDRPRGAEHAAPDLALDRPHPGPTDRAPDAFRPDPTAPVPESEREGLRPAMGAPPSLVR